MKELVITLETISPLAIRSDHAQGGSQSAQYISGTTLMGSLASTFKFTRQGQEKEFADLFLSGAVQYPNLYPALFADSGLQDAGTPVYPLPKTAQSCKRFSGFKRSYRDDDETRHGVRDTLIDWALYSMQSAPEDKRLKVMDDCKECSECHSPMDHFTGYYRRAATDPKEIISAKIDLRLQTHTGINRRTGTVQQRILYNREVLEEGMRFWGVLKIDDELARTLEPDNDVAETLEAFIDEVGHAGLVRVGTGRTRGLGKVLLSLTRADDGQNTFEQFKDRLMAFNRMMHEQANTFNIPLPDKFYFAVTLHAPTILRDDLLRYEGTLTAARLAQLASVGQDSNLPADTFELIYQAASGRHIAGWSELWGTPKANDYAIDTDSVFLFACRLEPDDDTLLRMLYAMEQRGIGQRRAEGFGRILISDPFHREVKML
ncbi:MAG TPA: RAMP superfamily CRISPR-associated protein [Ktedonobacteraceae bacterium]|nr:RAMP superfamily CRISPR-associated protein [Ktedonobacteraceae bacterium]